MIAANAALFTCCRRSDDACFELLMKSHLRDLDYQIDLLLQVLRQHNLKFILGQNLASEFTNLTNVKLTQV